MADQTVASLFTQSIPRESIRINPADREILRGLAGRLAELDARPVEAERRALWCRHNALEPTRPVVFCDPENGWNEIITDECIQCSGELARGWEMTFRKEIFWADQMGDDRVADAVFEVRDVYEESDWGMHGRVFKVAIRTSLRRMTKSTRDCRVEVIMKDNHTIGNNPENVTRWCQIVGEEADRLGA